MMSNGVEFRVKHNLPNGHGEVIFSLEHLKVQEVREKQG
jgi:hypothetical protein